MTVPQLTARAVLFGDGDAAEAVTRSPGWSAVTGGLAGALAAVSSPGRQVVERELATSLAALLQLDLGSLLVAGWRKHSALVAAAHATQGQPGATEVVRLAAHRISTAHRPYVEILINGVRLVTVHCELSLTFDVDTLMATVRQARIVALQSGQCTITAALACQGHDLVSRQVVIDPVVAVRLGQGIALLPEAH